MGWFRPWMDGRNAGSCDTHAHPHVCAQTHEHTRTHTSTHTSTHTHTHTHQHMQTYGTQACTCAPASFCSSHSATADPPCPARIQSRLSHMTRISCFAPSVALHACWQSSGVQVQDAGMHMICVSLEFARYTKLHSHAFLKACPRASLSGTLVSPGPRRKTTGAQRDRWRTA